MLHRTGKRFVTTVAESEKILAAERRHVALKKADILNEPPPPTGREEVKIAKRRISKAERDERMDITLALTPVRTYMGGFTRPTDLRTSSWNEGGRYVELGKVYHPPTASAYEPHTVFLLESRHPVQHGIGRCDARDHIVGVCRESDFPAVLEKLNSNRCPQEYMESMDNARWPWLPPKRAKYTKWWEAGENPKELHLQALEGAFDGETKQYPEAPAPKLEGTRAKRRAAEQAAKRATRMSAALLDHLHKTGIHMRTFSTSSRALADDTTGRDRANIPASAWSRPHKPSQDADDNVVPVYYVERKKQRDTISERKEEEGGLMAELSAGILSDGVAAQTKVIPEKIPVEVREPDGSVRHPSGFEPPTPETDFHPTASKTATEDDPLLTTVKITWDAALAPEPEADVAAATASGTLGKGARGFHTSAVTCASEVRLDVQPEPITDVVETAKADLKQLRSQYFPTLSSEPFWRPLLSLTFSTRPIALAISRLSKSLPRGLAFYASIDNHDRKYGPSFDARIRTLRLQRMSQLTIDLAHIMSGQRGGLLGARFSPEERGRGVNGEKLNEKIPLEKRTVKIGVGEWYALSDEVKEAFKLDAQNYQVSEAVDVFGLDEHGQRTDGVEWPKAESPMRSIKGLDTTVKEEVMARLTEEQKEMVEKMPWKIKPFIDDYCRENKMEIAYERAERHRSVMYP
ncbi:hypothetical protein QCA50_017994 [Cerrena zonata]|uniref:Uncharacterized protein n=1 Tax=Cerrena zonata TaxID=2478898 RepID=A0AAW0FC69_9APHY